MGSTKRGQVATYLARMPLVHGACGDTVAYLSSLREITLVKSGTPEDDQNVVIPVGLEPSYLAVGPKHVGVGMNNAALFYDISTVHKNGGRRGADAGHRQRGQGRRARQGPVGSARPG